MKEGVFLRAVTLSAFPPAQVLQARPQNGRAEYRGLVAGAEAGREGGFHAGGELEGFEGAVNLGFVTAGALVFEADAERTTVRGQGGEGKAPTLGFGETFAQFALVADGDASLFQGIQELVKGFVAQTAHVRLRLVRLVVQHEPNNAEAFLPVDTFFRKNRKKSANPFNGKTRLYDQ